jgi:hypothetical protein
MRKSVICCIALFFLFTKLYSLSLKEYFTQNVKSEIGLDKEELSLKSISKKDTLEIITVDAIYQFKVVHKNMDNTETLIIMKSGLEVFRNNIFSFGIGIKGITKCQIIKGKIFYVIHGISGTANGKGASISIFEILMNIKGKFQLVHAESFFSDMESFFVDNGNLNFICYDRVYQDDFDCLIPNYFRLINGSFVNVSNQYKGQMYNITDKRIFYKNELSGNIYERLNSYKYLEKPVLWIEN